MLFLCLSIDGLAQYNPLRRGQKSIFEESIEIEIGEYRRIRQKVYTSDTLFLNYQIEKARVDELLNANHRKDSIALIKETQYNHLLASKDKTILGLSNEFNNLERVSKKLRIFPDPTADTLTKVGGGVLIGIVIRSLIR